MIIANGTLEFKKKEGSTGTDPQTGYPLEPTERWSKPIPCQFYPHRSNLQARVGTENRHEVSYIILIEEEAQSESVRLKREDGTLVGDFSAISIEPLRAVGQTKIVI